MSLKEKLKHEIKAMAFATLYFGVWIAAMVLVKQLVLAEYDIAFWGMSRALVGTLVLSKVVLVLEHVPLGAWVQARPAWVDVVLRTALYTVGVAAVLFLERAIEGRHEHGGFLPSIAEEFRQTDSHHVLANLICVSGALFGFNVLSVIRRHLGEGGLLHLLMIPLPAEHEGPPPENES